MNNTVVGECKTSVIVEELRIKDRIKDAITDNLEVDWTFVNSLLSKLDVYTAAAQRCSQEDDPMGRLLLGEILTLQAPVETINLVLSRFPDCLLNNPAAFFIASQYGATCEVVIAMLNQVIASRNAHDLECPYPWIFSSLISVETVQTLVKTYPQGVLQASPFLSGFCPLDYFLRSSDMTQTQNFSPEIWSKFKLTLVAAECCDASVTCNKYELGLSPAHVLLQRILSSPDFFQNKMEAKHNIWILKELVKSDNWIFQKPNPNGEFPLHLVLDQECRATDHCGLVIARELVKTLLEAHPHAARLRCRRQLPIHMAVENKWPCHDLLLSLFPEALNAQHSVSNLLPFQAAATVSDTMDIGLDITFELLRANPSHILHSIPEQARVATQA